MQENHSWEWARNARSIQVSGVEPSDYETRVLVYTLYDSGNYIHHLFKIKRFMNFAHILNSCSSWGAFVDVSEIRNWFLVRVTRSMNV
jgi:hypothetical protein